MRGTFNIEKNETKLRSIYGGQDVVVVYDVIHTDREETNRYAVEATLKGLDDFCLELVFTSLLSTEDNNTATVDEYTLLDTLNDCTTRQLLGSPLMEEE